MIDFNIKKIEKALKNVRKPSHNEKPSMLSPKLDKNDKNSMHKKAKSLSKYPDPSELKTPEIHTKHMLPILHHSTYRLPSKMPSKFFSSPVKCDLFFKKVYEMDSRIISLELNQEDMLAIGNEDGELAIYNNYHCEELMASISNQNSVLINIRWIPCVFQPILGLEWVDGTIGIFNAKEGKLIEKIKENHKLYAFDFNCDGRYMASGGSSSQGIIYDSSKLKVLKTISDQNKSNNGGIYSLKFDKKQPESLFFGSVDEIVFHIDLRTDTKPNPIIKGPLLCPDTLDISQENVLTGSWGKNHGLFTWDLRKENEIIEKMEWPENKNIFSCQFGKNNEILAAGEKSCGVKIFKEKKFYNSDCTESVFCVKFANNKDFIICGNDDGLIKISDY